MTTRVFSKVAVAMQSALATAVTIGAGGVTKASTGVCTYTGTDPSNGDYGVFTDVQGMTELNNLVVRVANVNAGANTFELEGVDTTNFTTMVSANFQVITFGTSFSSMLDITFSGGDQKSTDDTTIHDEYDQEVYTTFTKLEMSSNLRWDPADAAQVACDAASRVGASRAFRLTFSDGAKYLFYGRVSYSGAPLGSAGETAKTPLKVGIAGRGKMYAT